MERRKIGSLEVSVIGLGTVNFGTDFFGKGCDEAASASIVDAAIESGINFFDTAEEYSVVSEFGRGRSEQLLGAALGSRRKDVVIATKFRADSLSEPGVRGVERIERAVEGSLKRLGTDYIDLLQQHFPHPELPTEETLEALDRVVRSGKVREVGCCNFDGAMIERADDTAAKLGTARFASAQNRFTMLDAAKGSEIEESSAEGAGNAEEDRVREVLADQPEGFVEACLDRGLSLIPFFPLASGLLTGKYNDGKPPPYSRLTEDSPASKVIAKSELSERNLAIARALEAYAREHDHSLLELAISWLASQPVVASVIAGATRPEQVRSNAAAGGWTLSDKNFADVEAVVVETVGG